MDESDNNDNNASDTDDDISMPNVKNCPPSWTKDLQGFDVPAFQCHSGPALPENFSDSSHPANYFKLFFTEKLIDTLFVKYTNQYACIHINKKCVTFPNYVD